MYFAAFEIQVLSMSAIKCYDKFRIFEFAMAMHQQKKKKKKTAEDLSETFVYRIRNGFGMPQHFTKD